MGRRGPPPTPTPILKARGSWRAKTRVSEPVPPSGRPECPSFLSPEAQAEWARQADFLAQMGLLAMCDRALLAAYCEAWGEFSQAAGELKKSKSLTIPTASGEIPNPLVAIKNHAAERLLKLAGQFGFSPSARARVQAQDPPRKDEKNRFFKAA